MDRTDLAYGRSATPAAAKPRAKISKKAAAHVKKHTKHHKPAPRQPTAATAPMPMPATAPVAPGMPPDDMGPLPGLSSAG